MAWNQLTLYATQEIAEQLSELLEGLGAVSVTLKEGGEEEILEPLPGETPLWCDTQVVGLFEQEHDMDEVVATLKQKSGLTNFPQSFIEPVSDQDWERAWLKDFKPMQFGRRLWIVPSTYEPIDKAAVNITLDPGLAFGTGTHATTALCLQWLDENFSSDAEGKDVVDYGCGSGVLAIAAAKLGASHVVAVDIDPQAVIATRENAKNNQVSNEIEACLVDDAAEMSADLLLANILANPLQALAKLFSESMKPDGRIVLSGILSDQVDSVLNVYVQWFEMDEPCYQDGWAMLSGKKKS